MLQRLAAAIFCATVLAPAATLDFVRSLQGPFTQAPVGAVGSPATPAAVTTGPDGSIYVVGNVSSPTLPITANALQPSFGAGICAGVFFPSFFPCTDAFIARIAPDGRILYATYLGGMAQDAAYAVAVDAEGHAYVTGRATIEAPFGNLNGPFVLKLSPDGAQAEIISPTAGGMSIALTPDGGIIVAGRGGPEPVSLGEPQAAPLYRAARGDESWTPANRGLPPRPFGDMAAGANGLLFAIVGGIYKSDDSGETWREQVTGLEDTPQRFEFPSIVAVHPTNPSRVLVGTLGRGVIRSDDGGETWAPSNAGLPPGEVVVYAIEFAPSDPNRAYLAGGNDLFFRSSDGGANWTPIASPRTSRFVSTAEIPALIVNPQQPGVVYASVRGFDFGPGPDGAVTHHSASGIFTSEDAGATWSPLRYELELGPESPFLTGPLALDSGDHSTLFAATRAGIEVSRDRGETWTLANPPGVGAAGAEQQGVTAFAADAAGPAVFAATRRGVFATSDQGRTWQPFAARSGVSFDVLATAPDRPSVVFGAWKDFTLSSSDGQAVVSKFSRGGRLEWAVAFGGSGNDAIGGLAVGRDGSVWVSGSTNSLDFPAVNAIQPVYPGGTSSAFLSQLDAAGSTLMFSTYLGGSSADQGGALALDSSGAVYATGATNSQDFPTTNAEQSEPGGGSDAFLVRLRGDQSGYDFQTYLGGSQTERGLGVAVDSTGRATVAGETVPPDIPIEPPPGAALQDAFLARFDAAGRKHNELLLRGPGYDYFGGLAVDPAGRAILAALASGGSIQLETDPAAFAVAAYSGFVAAVDYDREAVSPEVTSIENGASFIEGPIAPGEILTIRGRALGPLQGVSYSVAAQGRIVEELSGVRVSIGGIAATPLYVEAGQVNVVAPVSIEIGSSAEIVVETEAGHSEPTHREVVEAVPGLFALNATGAGPAAALDAALNPISPTNPATRRSAVVLYATGLGRTDPVSPDGELTPLEFPIPAPASPVEVRIGGLSAQIEWIGAAPTLPGGIVQLNVRLPELFAGGQHEVRLTVAGKSSQPGVTLAVR